MPSQSLCSICNNAVCQCRRCKDGKLKHTVCEGAHCGFDSVSQSCPAFKKIEVPNA